MADTRTTGVAPKQVTPAIFDHGLIMLTNLRTECGLDWEKPVTAHPERTGPGPRKIKVLRSADQEPVTG